MGFGLGLGLGLGRGIVRPAQVETSVAYAMGSSRQQPTTTSASIAFIWVM